MKIIIARLRLIFALILVLSIIAPRSAQATTDYIPKYSHCSCYHNAMEKKDIYAWGASSYITWTNPNLNGGYFSAHRVGVIQYSPWRFVAIGWAKLSTTGLRGFIEYDAGAGTINGFVVISGATHRYSQQYDPNTGKYWFYIDGANVYNVNVNLGFGDAVVAGGEVTYGVESMAHTRLYDLRWLKRNPDGTFVFSSWNGHVNYVDNPPYYNTNISSNSFYDDP